MNAMPAQTTVEFYNGSGCGLKCIVYIASNCTSCGSATVLNSVQLNNGATNAFSFTVPSGYQLCRYDLHASPGYTGMPVYTIPVACCGGYLYDGSVPALCQFGVPLIFEISDCTSLRIDVP